MKKLLALLLVIVLAVSFTACSVDNDKNTVTDGTVSETQTETTGKTDDTENIGNAETTETPKPDGDTTDKNNKDETEGEVSNETTTPSNDKTPETDNNKNTASTERPIVKDETTTKDDTIFNSYESFLTQSVNAQDFSFGSEPKNLSALQSSSCDCKIKFSGDLKNGNISVTINGKTHGHGWSTSTSYSSSQSNTSSSSLSNGLTYAGSTGVSHSVGTSQSQMLTPCDECGFVMGKNFIYIKLPDKSHGHGWSWPTNEKTKCNCLDYIVGDYDNGSFSIIVNNTVPAPTSPNHFHSWSSQVPTFKSHSISNSVSSSWSEGSSSASVSASIGTSSTHTQNWSVSETYTSSSMSGNPPCNDCGFRRYENKYGNKVITFKCLEGNGTHTIDYTTFNKIGEKVNCSCGLKTYGDKANGSYSFGGAYSEHGCGWSTATCSESVSHSWSTSISTTTGTSVGSSVSYGVGSSDSTASGGISWGESVGSSEGISFGTSVPYTPCACESEKVDNGFIVKCPTTNKYHVIKYS